MYSESILSLFAAASSGCGLYCSFSRYGADGASCDRQYAMRWLRLWIWRRKLPTNGKSCETALQFANLQARQSPIVSKSAKPTQ